MPSGVRRRAARKAGRDVTHDRKKLKRDARKKTREEQVKQYVRRNPLLAEEWDYKDTAARNYQKLGLARKLGHITGGEEKTFYTIKEKEEREEKERLKNAEKSETRELSENEARIERDADGNIVRIVYGKAVDIDDEDFESKNDSEDEENQPEGLKKLIALSKIEEPKIGREQSEAEQDWVKALYEKHGDDYEAMKWDKKLNIYQQSVGDIRKRVLKWKKTQGL